MATKTIQATTCYHCGEDCRNETVRLEEKIFCCDGCKLVYEILNKNNLCAYYHLNETPGVSQNIKIRPEKFAFLDKPEIQQSLIHFSDGKQSHITFYLPQIHCSSCLWLLENAHTLNPGIIESSVNFIKKEAYIVFDEAHTTLRQVVETLTSIGYEPHLSLQGVAKKKAGSINKTELYKLGIAGFCFANIMMLSFPEYLTNSGEIEPNIRTTLRYIIVFLSIPSLMYAGSGFFISAWKGLRNKFLNIDAPIALAIAITFLRSLYEIISNTGSGYLDSMSGIIFFMLLGRILQNKTYSSISFERNYKSFFPIAVNVIKEGVEIPTALDKVGKDDVIRVYNNELIPVDCILSTGTAEIDYSFVTGENLPVKKSPGEIIYAGGKQLGGTLTLVVIKEVSQSYLTNLWNKDAFRKKDEPAHSFIDGLGKYFTLIVFGIAVTTALYWMTNSQYTLMWNTLTTVLIVACPCALLLSSTFTNGHILRIFGKNKFYLRHASVIEEMASAKYLVFDKTGTITHPNQSTVIYEGSELTMHEKVEIASILYSSNHPLSKNILNYLEIKEQLPLTAYKNYPGKGIEGIVNDVKIKIGSYDFITGNRRDNESETSVYMSMDGTTIGKFKIKNNYRAGFYRLMQQLKKNFSISVLSGDNDSERSYLQSVIGDNTELLFKQMPEDKLAYIRHLQEKKYQKTIMFGDGLNDAGALKQSNVGIAITEHNNNFTPACDGILDASQFTSIYNFIRFAKAGQRIIQSTFMLSLVYNVIGLYFALRGTLSPLIAAVLMPSSSITIILITYALTELAAWKYGLLKHDLNHKEY